MDKQLIADVRASVHKLMDWLIQARLHGDNVNNHILIVNQILKQLNKLAIQPPKQPWEEIGISRATWYRDQQRSRNNNKNNNGNVPT